MFLYKTLLNEEEEGKKDNQPTLRLYHLSFYPPFAFHVYYKAQSAFVRLLFHGLICYHRTFAMPF